MMNKKQELCNYLIKSGELELYQVIQHSYAAFRKKNGLRVGGVGVKFINIAPTISTRADCLGVVVLDERNKENDK